MKQLAMIAVVLGVFGGMTALYDIQAGAQQPDAHPEHFAKCAKVCADCQVVCDSWFHHCAARVAKERSDFVKPMHSCVDCAEFCALAAKLSARQSPFSGTACEACAKICDECGNRCVTFEDDKQMQACAKSCRDCAKSCRAMIEHLKH